MHLEGDVVGEDIGDAAGYIYLRLRSTGGLVQANPTA
jgi:hypothetical protein